MNIAVRGAFDFELWNPKTGESEEADEKHSGMNGKKITKLVIDMPKISSLFLVEK
ncbi:MAG: hypothetical protein AB2L24_10530 [Mangrovibacterium sp.]